MNAECGPLKIQKAPGFRSRSGCFGGVSKKRAAADSAEEMKTSS